MVANTGVIYRPYVLKETRDPISGQVLGETNPEIIQHSTINPDVFLTVQKYLRTVISEGTAKVVLTTDVVDVAGEDRNWEK